MRKVNLLDFPDEYVIADGPSATATVTYGPEEAPTVVSVEVVAGDARLFPDRSYRHQDLVKRIAREE